MRSGKIKRRLLRAIARGAVIPQDTSTLENPAILERLAQAKRRGENRVCAAPHRPQAVAAGPLLPRQVHPHLGLVVLDRRSRHVHQRLVHLPGKREGRRVVGHGR